MTARAGRPSRWEQPTPEWLKENESPALDAWLDNMSSKSPRTLTSYAQFLRMFSDYTGLSPQQIYDKRLTDIGNGERLQKRSIERQVKTLMSLMGEGVHPWGKGPNHDKPMAPSTCRQLFKAVYSFFEIFEERDYELYIKKKDLPQGDYNGSSGIMASQILDMWRIGGEAVLRNRGSMTFLKDSGIRISDLCALNVGDYREARSRSQFNDAGEPFLVFDPIRTQKCKIVALIHIGPETVSDVDLYLERERRGALDSEPLFAKWEKKREGGKKRIDTEDPRMTRSAFSALFIRLRDIIPQNGRKVSAHSLRKFHKTSLMFNRGMKETWIRKLQGKKIDPYSRDAEVLPGELVKAYMGAYDTLRIHSKPESETVRDLAREVSEMKAQLEAYQSSLIGVDNSRALRVMALLFPDTPPEEMSARLAKAIKRIEEQDKISLKVEKREA